MTIRLLY